MGLYIECKPGTTQYYSECIPNEEYTTIMSNKSLLGGCFLGIGSFALIMSIVCFIIFKAGKSKERILFRFSIAGLIILIASVFIYMILKVFLF